MNFVPSSSVISRSTICSWVWPVISARRTGAVRARRSAPRAGAGSRRSRSPCRPSSAGCARSSSGRSRSPARAPRSSRRRASPSGRGTGARRRRATRRSAAAPRRRSCRRRGSTCPSPESPVITISASRGSSTSMPLRLCSRAPEMTIRSEAATQVDSTQANRCSRGRIGVRTSTFRVEYATQKRDKRHQRLAALAAKQHGVVSVPADRRPARLLGTGDQASGSRRSIASHPSRGLRGGARPSHGPGPLSGGGCWLADRRRFSATPRPHGFGGCCRPVLRWPT